MKRIICIGDNSNDGNTAGPLVHNELRGREMPDGVELVDGGLSGLDLLELVMGCEHVVFVDTVTGSDGPGSVRLIDDWTEVIERSGRHDHQAGLGSLLEFLQQSAEGPVPEIQVVGLEPPFSETAIWRAAEISLVAVMRERRALDRTRAATRNRIA